MNVQIQQMREEYFEINIFLTETLAETNTSSKHLLAEKKARFRVLADTIQEAGKQLKKMEIALFLNNYCFNGTYYPFFFGEKPNQTKLIPMTIKEGLKIFYQDRFEGGCKWPILNPETNEFFVPVLKEVTYIPLPTLFRKLKGFVPEVENQELQILKVLPSYPEQTREIQFFNQYHTRFHLFPQPYPFSQ